MDGNARHRLVETHRGTVYPWQCDHVGHMNVMWYVGKFDEATWCLFTHLGLTPTFLREGGRGMAAIDQRIAYRRELRAGDTIVVSSGVLELREKGLTFFHEMRLIESGALAAVTRLTALHMDTTTRRATALPSEIAEKARDLVAPHDLPW